MLKDVIKIIYNTKFCKIIPEDLISGTKSTWSPIVNHCVKDNRLHDIVNHNVKYNRLHDNGRRIKLWLDDWTNNGS